MAAKNTIPMLVAIYKNRNTASKTYGQFYGRVFPRDGLNQSLGTVLDDHFLTELFSHGFSDSFLKQ